MSKVFEVKGTTTDITVCDLCGRNDLSKTVVLVDADGEVSHFGTDCASRAAGWTVKEVEAKVKDAERAAIEAHLSAMHAESNRRHEWMVATTGITDIALAIKALGGLKAASEAYKAAR